MPHTNNFYIIKTKVDGRDIWLLRHLQYPDKARTVEELVRRFALCVYHFYNTESEMKVALNSMYDAICKDYGGPPRHGVMNIDIFHISIPIDVTDYIAVDYSYHHICSPPNVLTFGPNFLEHVDTTQQRVQLRSKLRELPLTWERVDNL